MTTAPISVERLRELLAAATELPWQAMNEYQWDSIIGGIDGPDDGEMHYEFVTDITSHHDRSRANAALIVAAVNALPALLSLAKRVAGAPRGTIDSVNFEGVRPTWHVIDDRDAVPLNEPRRIALVEIVGGEE